MAFMCFIPIVQGGNLDSDSIKMQALEVIEYLKKETGKNFFFSNTAIDTKKEVSIVLKGATPEDILKSLSEQIAFDYEIREKIIVLTPAKKKIPVVNEKKEVKPQQEKKTITGSVVDEDGEGIMSATVTYRFNSVLQGTITQLDGSFELELPVSVNKLTIKFIGYESFEMVLDEKTDYHIQ